ncbi:MAG TPA: ABC transporter ATP-binding protein [Acidimicrobiales bacterium]|nr:ABC transporter ATP-binding protein [Acidimicrobiales bacterium]
MIAIDHLTKRFGSTVAVNDLSFTVRPGVVTGFLGPNGSGKSTTMRVILGLDHPDKGSATIDGKRFDRLKAPLREVGALLDAKAAHPGRTARNHLKALAASNQIARSRVDEVLDFAGIATVADKKVGQFSLGMCQRLGIAAAMLGDPAVLMFDEPVNGLDPEGIRWIRESFRSLADQGRTVFVSSHLMSEMALTADEIVVIGKGSFITRGTVDDLTATVQGTVFVRASDPDALTEALCARHAIVTPVNDRALSVSGLTSDEVGETAHAASVTIWELTPQRASLEEVFMELTADSVEFGGAKLESHP